MDQAGFEPAPLDNPGEHPNQLGPLYPLASHLCLALIQEPYGLVSETLTLCTAIYSETRPDHKTLG